MNKKIILLLAIVLVFGGVSFLWTGDEKKIRNNLTSLADYCSSAGQEPVMETLHKAARAARLFADPCKIQIESLKIDHEFNQKELTDRILTMKKRLSNTIFSFHDTVVKMPEDNKGEIITTLRLNGRTVDEQFTDAYEIKITVEKQSGDWQFASLAVVEFMKR